MRLVTAGGIEGPVSYLLPSKDLSAAVVGMKDKVDWSSVKVRQTPEQEYESKSEHIYVRNESGCELAVRLPASGDSLLIAPGEWVPLRISAEENELDYTVDFVLP